MITDSSGKALRINVQFDTYFDSFLIHLKFLCKACYHYKALNVFLYLYCKSLSMCPKHPMLSKSLQLKTTVYIKLMLKKLLHIHINVGIIIVLCTL